MVKTVKYTSDFPDGEKYNCAERLPDCDVTASYHVCFEDGSGKSVCSSCFEKRVNAGDWNTDSTEALLAS
jgi:GH24 family phage-related lysozyme (muramidase)